MKIVELAEALAPGLGVDVIGIRPGEKLHEVMITSDDSRNTLELDDRYVILPPFKFWDQKTEVISNSKPVTQSFSYSSDNNHEWLSKDLLSELCNGF